MKPVDTRKPAAQLSDAVPFPLSAAQRATWFAQQLRARGADLDSALRGAARRPRRRPVAAGDRRGRPRVPVAAPQGGRGRRPADAVRGSTRPTFPLTVIDLRGEDDPVAAAHEWMHRGYQAPLDLGADRLVETSILCVGESHYLWYSRIHHVALDGYGAMTMVNRIAHRYSASVAGREPDPNRPATLRELCDIDARYRSLRSVRGGSGVLGGANRGSRGIDAGRRRRRARTRQERRSRVPRCPRSAVAGLRGSDRQATADRRSHDHRRLRLLPLAADGAKPMYSCKFRCPAGQRHCCAIPAA